MIQNDVEMKEECIPFKIDETSEDKKHMKEEPVIHEKVEFMAILNSRGMTEVFVEGQHLSVEDLRKHIEEDPTIWETICNLRRWNTNGFKSKTKEKPRILDYLDNDVPKYPTPVEFHLSSASHATTVKPLQAILKSRQIKPPDSEFAWWTLAITKEEIESAEKLYLQNKNIEMKDSFLMEFTTSPAFQRDTSRYGDYRFTFPLTELMEMYKEQNCGGKEPVLRVFKTMFYLQEIVYAVLVHSPQDNKEFGDYPLLEESNFVHYKDGQIMWKAQAISGDHQVTLSVDTSEPRLNVKRLYSSTYYVWDNVCLAFHLPAQKALDFTTDRLIEALAACKLHKKNLLGQEDFSYDAKTVVDCLKTTLEDAENADA
ncbi:hypothetical protein NFI96_021719 [Prochilodus magdalenae]|nr:hypothetical protein NFI96_021719 [Prochilodus magdalenae]